MCDDDVNQGQDDLSLSRRTFGLSAAAAAALAATHANAQTAVVEKAVDVKTPDGTCDAVLFHPEGKGKWPAVLIWTDIMGLRPVYHDMGKRLAAQGYVVLIPNTYYRVHHSPVVQPGFNINNPDDRVKLPPFAVGFTDEAKVRDSRAYIAFLDAQPQTNTKVKMAVQGHCMGGPLSIISAADQPDRIGAVAHYHPGNDMVTDKPDSPHLLIPKMKAQVLSCIAKNDDERRPDIKVVLKKSFDDAHLQASVELYPVLHGWTIHDAAAWNQEQADRSFAETIALYKRALV